MLVLDYFVRRDFVPARARLGADSFLRSLLGPSQGVGLDPPQSTATAAAIGPARVRLRMC